jgi:hypothetical protein
MKRKIGLVAVMIFGVIILQAQEKTNQPSGASFGIRGGINFQNINGKDENGDKLDNDILTAFNAGINLEIPVGGGFYFQPGLLYTIKGAKSKEVIGGNTIKGKVRISYIEMPLNLLYKPQLGNGKLLLGFGPYIALGIGGEVTYKGDGIKESSDIKFKKTVKLTDPDDVAYFRPMDAGANLLAGYEFGNKVSFQLNAQLGLTKINPDYEGDPDSKASAKNTGFGFSLGYRF